MDVRVVLEELVLDGVDPRDPAVARALERALAQAVPAQADVSPRLVAAQIAAAVRKEASA